MKIITFKGLAEGGLIEGASKGLTVAGTGYNPFTLPNLQSSYFGQRILTIRPMAMFCCSSECEFLYFSGQNTKQLHAFTAELKQNFLSK